MSRPDVVQRLVEDALAAMVETAEQLHPSNDEVLSAYFTLLRRGIMAAQTLSKRPEETRKAMRDTLFVLLAEVADSKLN